MKKMISLPKIRLKRRKSAESNGKITNDTVAEHRERVLAGGRRFKYPLQYAKHKLVINTIAISVAAVTLLAGLGWWQLYIVQNTSTVFYRVVQITHLPVGSIDGTSVLYSDYMLYYRPSAYYLNKYDEISPASQDGKLQLEYKKQDAMNRAIADAYARKVAHERNITVSNDEVNDALNSLTQAENGTLSTDAVNSSASQVFGMSAQDTRTQYEHSLLRGKVAFALDDTAASIANRVVAMISKKQPLKDIASSINNDKKDSVQYGVSGDMDKSSVFDGVRISDLFDAKVDGTVGPLKSFTTDGYLFARIIAKENTQVNFEFIHIPLTTFDDNIAKLKSDGKVQEYITIDPSKY